MLEKIKLHKKLSFAITVFVITIPLLLLVFRFLNAQDKKEGARPTPTPAYGNTENLPLVNKQQLPELRIQPAAGAEANELGEVIYNLQEPTLQPTIPVYTIIRESFSETFINAIVKSLAPNGTQSTEGTTQYPTRVWVSGEKRLTFRMASGIVEYSTGIIPANDSLTQSELVALAANFLKNLNLNTSNQLDKGPRVNYFSSRAADLVEVDSIGEADMLDLSYAEEINGKKIYRQYGSDAQTHVWISKSGEILKLSYKKPLTYRASGKVATLPFDEAKNTMGFAVTVALLGGAYHANTITAPSSTELKNVELGYIEDGTGKMLLPIYVFGGISKTQNEEEEIIVYLPAFK